MLGLLVAIVLSWILLWFFSKEHITVLGVIPTVQRIKEFFFGMVVMALFCVINFLGQAYFKEISYSQNTDYGLWEALIGIKWTLIAALFEEFIFRGALLYILIKKLGVVKACIISAIAFGIYHWFSYGMIGSGLVPMTYIFLLTGAGGFMFAYAFAKTKSLWAPFGLHFGWIVISIIIFSEGPLGEQWFSASGDVVELNGWTTLLFFLWQTVMVPGLIIWYFRNKYKS